MSSEFEEFIVYPKDKTPRPNSYYKWLWITVFVLSIIGVYYSMPPARQPDAGGFIKTLFLLALVSAGLSAAVAAYYGLCDNQSPPE